MESREEYVGLVTDSALELAVQGYALSEAIPQILTQARRHWDHLMGEARAR